MKKLWIIVVAVMVSAFALTGCGGSADAKSVGSAQSAASSSTAELAPSSETPAPTADEKATITLQDDQNGTAVQKVAVGQQIAELTVPFQYEEKDGKRVLTEIGKATAKKVSGWDSVQFDASKNTKLEIDNDGTKRIVRVTYYASIGSGDAAYEAEVTIDLDADKPAITLVNDREGIAVQEVSIGKRDYVAEITVPFRYEQQYGKAVVTEIGKATAKNVAGWFRVNQDASEGTKQVGSGNGGTKAVVYVAYEASIGQGWQTYDDLIEIDLRNI